MFPPLMAPEPISGFFFYAGFEEAPELAHHRIIPCFLRGGNLREFNPVISAPLAVDTQEKEAGANLSAQYFRAVDKGSVMIKEDYLVVLIGVARPSVGYKAACPGTVVASQQRPHRLLLRQKVDGPAASDAVVDGVPCSAVKRPVD